MCAEDCNPFGQRGESIKDEVFLSIFVLQTRDAYQIQQWGIHAICTGSIEHINGRYVENAWSQSKLSIRCLGKNNGVAP